MKIIRIRDVPAIERTLARFDAWWSGLSGRERVLLSALVVLFVLVVAIYGVIKPIQSAHAEAVADIRKYETLNARILAAGTLTTERTPQRTGTPADIVTGAAGSAGVTATTQPISGGVRASVEGADYDAVLHWIDDISGSSTLSIGHVEIVRADTPGRVSATVDFTR